MPITTTTNNVVLIDPSVWPEAYNRSIQLVDVLSNKFAIVSCCLPGKGPVKRLVLRSAVRKVTNEQAPEPVLDNPPLRWGALVTLRNGHKVLCTHPDFELNGIWRGIPLGYKSFHEYHYTDIKDISHPEALVA